MREQWTDDRMDDLSRQVATGFARTDERFTQVDARFVQVDERFAQAHADMVALRVEVKETSTGLRQEMNETNAELRQGIKESNAELRQEIKESNAELRQGILAMRSEMDRRFDTLTKRFDGLQLTLIAAIVTGTIGLIVAGVG